MEYIDLFLGVPYKMLTGIAGYGIIGLAGLYFGLIIYRSGKTSIEKQ